MFYIDICLITVNCAKARYRSYFYEIPLWCSLFNISSESSNLKQKILLFISDLSLFNVKTRYINNSTLVFSRIDFAVFPII